MGDPIETTRPSGVLVLQMLGAVAEFERNLIRERKRPGITAAKVPGRETGSPGLRRRDQALLAKMEAGRAQGRIERLRPHADEWLAVVRRL